MKYSEPYKLARDAYRFHLAMVLLALPLTLILADKDYHFAAIIWLLITGLNALGVVRCGKAMNRMRALRTHINP